MELQISGHRPRYITQEDLENAYETWKIIGKINSSVCEAVGMSRGSFAKWKEWFSKQFNKMLIRDGLDEDSLGEEGSYYVGLFRIEHLKTIETGSFAGFPESEIADLCNVSLQTLQRWRRTIPAVKKAFDRGDKLSVCEVTNSLRKRANGYEVEEDKVVSYLGNYHVVQVRKIYPPEVNAIKVVLLNKSNWVTEPQQGMLNADDREISWDVRNRYYEEEESEEVDE